MGGVDEAQLSSSLILYAESCTGRGRTRIHCTFLAIKGRKRERGGEERDGWFRIILFLRPPRSRSKRRSISTPVSNERKKEKEGREMPLERFPPLLIALHCHRAAAPLPGGVNSRKGRKKKKPPRTPLYPVISFFGNVGVEEKVEEKGQRRLSTTTTDYVITIIYIFFLGSSYRHHQKEPPALLPRIRSEKEKEKERGVGSGNLPSLLPLLFPFSAARCQEGQSEGA